jgi:DNA-binding transcriptional LysR family regulator
MKIVVVGAPTYFARRRPPRTPDDLARHSCVQYRLTADGDVLEWPSKRNRKSRCVAVDGQVIVNDADLAVRAAVDGLGIAYALEALAEPFLLSAYCKTGRHRSRECSSIIPRADKSRPRCAPSST